MTDSKATRLSKIAREFNVGISTIVEFLHKKGEKIDSNPNSKITPQQYELLIEEFSSDLSAKKESEKLNLKHFKEKQQSVSITDIDDKEDDVYGEQEELLVKDTRGSGIIYETDTERHWSTYQNQKLLAELILSPR